ncbi:MAG: hypothetical protein ACM3YE_08560 [Bacteroidota bacterium]
MKKAARILLITCFLLSFGSIHKTAASDKYILPAYPGWTPLTREELVQDFIFAVDNQTIKIFYSKDPIDKVSAFYGLKPDPGSRPELANKKQIGSYSRIVMPKDQVFKILLAKTGITVDAQDVGVTVLYREPSLGNEHKIYNSLITQVHFKRHTEAEMKEIEKKYHYIIQGQVFYNLSLDHKISDKHYETMYRIIYNKYKDRLQPRPLTAKEKEELQRKVAALKKQGKEKEAKELELQLYSIADHWDDVVAYFRELEKYSYCTIIMMNTHPETWTY